MDVDDKYLKGFNSGYLLRKHEPILAKKLMEGVVTKTEFVQGLNDGAQQYENELEQELTKFKEKSLGKEKDRDFDIGL